MARVLVVDDHTSVLMLLESILQQQGHVVTGVTNPIDALDKLNSLPFDLVITDAAMPGGVSGFDLIRTIRNTGALAPMPVIMLSGRREKRDIEKGIASGADDYIVKPIDPDVFTAKIEAILRKKVPSSINFVECVVKQPFQWVVMNEVIRLSEIGITVNSTLSAEVGSKVRVNSPFLIELSLEHLQLRVVSCEKASGGLPFFVIKMHFLGLTEATLQPLRVWIRNNQIKSA